MKKLNLVSTVILSDWSVSGKLVCSPLTSNEFANLINSAENILNYCGHPETTNKLKESGLNIPDQLVKKDNNGNVILHPKFKTPQGEFWDGKGLAIAARPKNGVRNAANTGDTIINSLDELEFIKFEFIAD